MKELGLYIHIPFCERKCKYCDFYSVKKTDVIEKDFVESLCYELRSYKDKCKGYVVNTIFIGGGTPSYLKPTNIGLIINEIKNNYNLSDDIEISMEANPNSINMTNALMYKEYGINRMSLGVQSLDNNVLELIGRLHNSDDAINAIRILKKANFRNINTDVIFNIPGQNVISINETINRLILEDINHISFYSLKLEEGTVMYDMEKRGQIFLADDEEERNMYYAGREIMENNNYKQYEISNFSKVGFECRHNIKYWTGKEYIGFGPFAHSCFNNKRYNNISNIDLYYKNRYNPDEYRHLNEILTDDTKMFEFIILRLRMNKGFLISDFRDYFDKGFCDIYKNKLEKLINLELINFDGNNVRLTKKGMDISNYVFGEFLE